MTSKLKNKQRRYARLPDVLRELYDLCIAIPQRLFKLPFPLDFLKTHQEPIALQQLEARTLLSASLIDQIDDLTSFDFSSLSRDITREGVVVERIAWVHNTQQRIITNSIDNLLDDRYDQTNQYHYDENQKVILYKTDNKSDGIIDLTINKSFDEHGNIIQEIKDYYQSDNSDRTTDYSYNINNEIASIKIDNRNDGEIDTHTTYIYDVNGNLIRYMTSQPQSGQSSSGYYQYDSHQRITFVEISNGSYVSREAYTYNDDDQITSSIYGNNYASYAHYYEYDSNGRRIRSEYDRGNDGDIDRTEVATFNQSNLLTSSTTYSDNNSRTIQFTYDEYENTTQELILVNGSITHQTDFSYNADQVLTKITWRHIGTENTSTYYYKYDSDKRLYETQYDYNNNGTIDRISNHDYAWAWSEGRIFISDDAFYDAADNDSLYNITVSLESVGSLLPDETTAFNKWNAPLIHAFRATSYSLLRGSAGRVATLKAAGVIRDTSTEGTIKYTGHITEASISIWQASDRSLKQPRIYIIDINTQQLTSQSQRTIQESQSNRANRGHKTSIGQLTREASRPPLSPKYMPDTKKKVTSYHIKTVPRKTEESQSLLSPITFSLSAFLIQQNLQPNRQVPTQSRSIEHPGEADHNTLTSYSTRNPTPTRHIADQRNTPQFSSFEHINAWPLFLILDNKTLLDDSILKGDHPAQLAAGLIRSKEFYILAESAIRESLKTKERFSYKLLEQTKPLEKELTDRSEEKFKEIDLDDSVPLWIRRSFKNGEYRTVITTQPILVYRIFGGLADVSGGFSTTSPVNHRIQAKIDLALLPEWGNSRQYEAVIQIPTDTILQIGEVGEQQLTKTGTILNGQAEQVLLPSDWPLNWIQAVRLIGS